MCQLKVSKLYLNMSLVSINIILDPLSPTIFTLNIPDCPFMLILFQESELNCGTKFPYLKETLQKMH